MAGLQAGAFAPTDTFPNQPYQQSWLCHEIQMDDTPWSRSRRITGYDFMSCPKSPPSSGRDLVIGAGPAGLTAAWELIEAGRPAPLVVEADSQVGGISKTINHHGNRMDLGGHRFFSKSDWVMDWWLRMLPLAAPAEDVRLGYQQRNTRLSSQAPCASPGDPAFLIRPRQSRIFFKGRFFDYPVRLNAQLIRNLGLLSVLRMGASYARSSLVPRKPEQNLEDFLVNRFGQALYRTFFEAYTEKVWGVPCREMSA